MASSRDLTEGGILSKLLLVAAPIMGTQFIQMAYNLTDMFWLGRVGSEAVAASGAAGLYLWLSVGFVLLGRVGAEIGVAQSIGRGDRGAALAFSRNALLMAVGLGVLYGTPMITLSRPLVGFFGFREAGVAADAAAYLRVAGLAMPLSFAASVLTGTYNASGDSRTPFLINAVGLGVNMILDPLFILTLGWGVRGAAAATVIAQTLVGALLWIAIRRFTGRPFDRYPLRFRPDPARIRVMLRWSLPGCLESLLFCFLTMVTSRIEASFGAAAVAVSRVGSQAESLSWLIGGGFGSALVAFIGQNHGAGKAARVRRGTRLAVGAMAAWGAAVTAFLWFGARGWFAFFLPDPASAALGVSYLRIIALAQVPMNLEAVGAGAFKGTGRTLPPSLASILTNATRPALAWALSRRLGVYGVWAAISATACARGLWVWGWYALSARRGGDGASGPG